jgi:hypothetical protein
MPIRPMPFEKELPPEDLEKWNEIKHILSDQELCFEQSSKVDSTDLSTEDMNSWIDSMFSQNKRGHHPITRRFKEESQAKLELSKVMKEFNEKPVSEFLKKTDKIREKYRLENKMINQDEIAKTFIKFIEYQENKSKNDSEKISDYELFQEPNDLVSSNTNWYEISDSGDLTPLYEPGGREFAWNHKDQMKNCLKSIVLNHPKSCPDIVITTILPKPHQPHQGTEIHSKIALYWCSKVLREDGSYERSTKVTSDGLVEDWRGVYPLSSEIETFASCIRDKINKLCTTFVTYQRLVLYRTEA